MRFPRNARIVRSHLDAAPFAGVFFCLLIFVLLGSVIYTPGVAIHLPESTSALPGADGPALAVVLDPNGQLYYRNQLIGEADLVRRLKEEGARQTEPLTLVVLADKSATLEQMIHLHDLVAGAGVKQIVQATQPRLFDAAPATHNP